MEEIKKEVEEQKIIKIGTKMKMSFVALTHEGLGIAKINGYNKFGTYYENFPIFVMGALPNEEGYIEITRLTKSFGYGKALKMFPDTFTKDRTTPVCKAYPECGGCNIMHMTYSAQLKFKEQTVKDTLERIGTLKDVEIKPIIGTTHPLRYRNKVQVPFGMSFKKTTAGFYKRDTHQIIPLESCYIQSDISTSLTLFVRNLCNEYKIKGYDEKYHTGDIRHILIKTNNIGEIMLVLVMLHQDLPDLKPMIEKIVKRYPTVKSVIMNINKARGNTTLGDKNILLYGDPYLTDTLCGKTFRIGATSFYQVNHEQTEILYKKALEIANFTKEDVLIDAYCGIGTIGIIAADKVKQVYGVEIVPEAIKNANENLKLNGVTNATYLCNKAEDQIVEWMSSGLPATAIVVDPPRKGCDETFLETIDKMNINKVLYISCNPSTLARDLKYLVEHGYHVFDVQPIDMFPQSSHIETIVYLEKQ